MSGYTPSEEEVLDIFYDAPGMQSDKAAGMLERFLADDRRKTAVKALRDAAERLPNTSWAPVGTWLLDRAHRIEKGASDV